ncbi:hypothetical protein J2125_003216 [Erwinia toletana]|uniref:Uncharacterized protein n=1 Tax=Winslowiella toletana TaxID=92490 RepID=A0ABS4PBK7_9GAMM|nr:hypothetical protein [Winslowiella toletana]MBP2170024.1 hypothetical protein [Winslowiella toletana]
MSWLFISAIIILSPLHAEETLHIERGTQGLDKFIIAVNNQGQQPLSCEVSTAHWYSVALGDILPGRTLQAALWKNTRSGEVFILNQQQDRLPVQRFWCGQQGASWQTRYQFTLPDRRQQTPQSHQFNCREAAHSTQCQPVS